LQIANIQMKLYLYILSYIPHSTKVGSHIRMLEKYFVREVADKKYWNLIVYDVRQDRIILRNISLGFLMFIQPSN
jgi:hypothetical protein